MKCVDCGGQRFRASVMEDSLLVGDRTYTGAVAARQCSKCGARYVTAADQQAFERRVALHLAENGPVDGEGFAFLRSMLRLPAAALAGMLGVRAETLSRWERGHVAVDRNAWVVVGDLLRDLVAGRTETARRIAALTKPARRGRVRLDDGRSSSSA